MRSPENDFDRKLLNDRKYPYSLYTHMDTLPDISVSLILQPDWKKDDFQSSLISPEPKPNIFQRFFLWMRKKRQ